MVPTESAAVGDAVPTGVRWLLPGLTLLLAGLAAFQLVLLVPRCVWVTQRLGVREPGYLRLLLGLPGWVGPAAVLALGVVALWQRGSVRRSALLATLAVAVNVGCLIGILESLFQVLSRAPSP
jgi:hypothetical protein